MAGEKAFQRRFLELNLATFRAVGKTNRESWKAISHSPLQGGSTVVDTGSEESGDAGIVYWEYNDRLPQPGLLIPDTEITVVSLKRYGVGPEPKPVRRGSLYRRETIVGYEDSMPRTSGEPHEVSISDSGDVHSDTEVLIPRGPLAALEGGTDQVYDSPGKMLRDFANHGTKALIIAEFVAVTVNTAHGATIDTTPLKEVRDAWKDEVTASGEHPIYISPYIENLRPQG